MKKVSWKEYMNNTQMKLYHYIGIHLVADKNINIEELSIELEKQIKKYLPNTHITLETNEPYWKDPEANNIVYSITNNKNIKIEKLLTLFPISWDYSESSAYNVDIKQNVNHETAVWSQLCYPEEMFLISIVRWVHIYTWETNEDIAIN